MFKLLILSLCLGLSNLAFSKSLALSFDDGLDPSTNPQAQKINDDLLGRVPNLEK